MITDTKFDAIRNLPATALVGIRMGWTGDAELAALVAEYDAAINAANNAELTRYFASQVGRTDLTHSGYVL